MSDFSNEDRRREFLRRMRRERRGEGGARREPPPVQRDDEPAAPAPRLTLREFARQRADEPPAPRPTRGQLRDELPAFDFAPLAPGAPPADAAAAEARRRALHQRAEWLRAILELTREDLAALET